MNSDLLKTVENLIQVNNFTEAEELILSRSPDSETLNNVGVLYYKREKTDFAEKYFLQSIDLNNKYQTAILNLAELYLNAGNWSAASQYYKKFIEFNPDNINVINQLALVYTENGEFQKARNTIKLSLKVDPDQAEPKEMLAELEKIIGHKTKVTDSNNGTASTHGQNESNNSHFIEDKGNFSNHNSLGLYLKPGEEIREYVNLIYYLQNNSEKFSRDDLLYLIQINFRNIITSYFNACSVVQNDVDNLLALVNLLEQKFGCRNKFDKSNNELFIISLFDFLNEHLPQSRDRKEIHLKGFPELFKDPSLNDNIISMYMDVKDAFNPLYNDGLLSSFMVHGSMSTLDYTPFSDFDTQIFLTNRVFSSVDCLKKTALAISGNVKLLRQFDPLQHHGFFFCTDLDRRCYPEAFLPLSTMDCATSVHGDKSQEFFIRHSDYQIKYAVWHTGYFFRTSYILKIFPENPFDIKRFLSRFLLLPVLLLELKENIFPYKRNSFSLARKHFDPEVWQAVDIATKARDDWNPYRLMRFNKDFYRKTFEFSEVILKTLKETACEQQTFSNK